MVAAQEVARARGGLALLATRTFALLSERMTVGPAGGAPRATRTSRAYATSSPALALAMASLSCEESRGPVPCGIDPIQCLSAQVRSW